LALIKTSRESKRIQFNLLENTLQNLETVQGALDSRLTFRGNASILFLYVI